MSCSRWRACWGRHTCAARNGFSGSLRGGWPCFALALVLVIPSGIYASSMIERTYQASISETLEDAKKNVAEVETDATTEADTDQQSGLSGLFSKVKDSIGSAGQRHTGKIQADAEQSH